MEEGKKYSISIIDYTMYHLLSVGWGFGYIFLFVLF